jgi:branched-chain amino acid transport system permease protein
VAVAQIIVVAGTVLLMAGLTVFVSRTQLGRAMRATSYDRQAAEMMGIDVDRVIAATFFIGSALAGAAAVFNGLVFQQIWPYMGFNAGLKAFTAAVIGGIGNLPGAVMGGLAIGLAESFTIGYVSSTFSDALVFVLLIGVMILRPHGLFGRPEPAKV